MRALCHEGLNRVPSVTRDVRGCRGMRTSLRYRGAVGFREGGQVSGVQGSMDENKSRVRGYRVLRIRGYEHRGSVVSALGGLMRVPGGMRGQDSMPRGT